MNYISNKAEYDPIFKDIFGFFFRKIGDINEKTRIDFIFAEFDKQLLQKTTRDIKEGNPNDDTIWLQRDSTFRLLKLPRNILYIRNGILIKELFKILSKDDYKIEFRSYSVQAFKFKEMIHEHYLFSFPKNVQSPFLNNFALNHDKKLAGNKVYTKDSTIILEYVLKNIKNIL